jgi:hypothetical protein
MPAFGYWFSGTALFLAGSFSLTVAMALIGIKDMISNKLIVGILLASLVLMLIGWWTAAKQEEQSTKRDSDITAALSANQRQETVISDLKKKLEEEGKRAAATQETVNTIAAALGIHGYASPEALKAKISEIESENRRQFLVLLTRNYILSHDEISSEMMAGLQLPPEDWLNSELQKYGKLWRVRNVRGPNYETYDVREP